MPDTTDSPALKRLLCATDFSDGAAAALGFAIGLATPLHAELRIVHVHPSPVPSGTPMAWRAEAPGIEKKSATDIRHDLDRFGQTALAAGLATETVLLHGDPSDQIVREAQHAAADIIAMGRHAQGAWNPWKQGSVAERVLREASCPVLVVKPCLRRRGERSRRVLCGVDLGETSGPTLRYALALTAVCEADLFVLHAAAGGEAERARRSLAAAVARASTATAPPIRASVTTGAPHEALLALARQNDVDLIVVGSHGGGLVDRQFLGSTALHVLRHAESPVLVVPAHVAMRRERLGTSPEALAGPHEP